MDSFVTTTNEILEIVNNVLWHDAAMYAILGVGILFTLWSGFSQYRALTHGVAITAGKYDRPGDPGAINHFQALSTALSATVGIGNIGGVALAVALGGPGAIFWMWVVGLVGMALKTTEVTLALMYRNVDDPDNPHGGAMWVADKGLTRMSSSLKPLGKLLAVLFCITLLIATITGGNMFQAFNVAEVTAENFEVPRIYTGIALAVFAALVIIGGIKRIGAVAGSLVPFMCGVYLLAACYVLAIHLGELPDLMALIFRSAFNPLEAQGAFLGGTFGLAFSYGMQRALFSNEAGQGSAPIAHSAARTDEPVREGLVSGLEPFIDTLVVCTMTALVILASGTWNRGPEAEFSEPPRVIAAGEGVWTLEPGPLPPRVNGQWNPRSKIFVLLRGQTNGQTNGSLHRLAGKVSPAGDSFIVEWETHKSEQKPELAGPGIYGDYVGAALTSHAFDRVVSGMGRWMVTLAVWLFAFSTIISWNYYGEQGMIYLFGPKSVHLYRVVYCLCIVAACTRLIQTERELNNLSNLGTGVMLFANLPICLIFARQTMSTYWNYIRRLKAGEFDKRAGSQVG